ncbi:MAG: hypothetical protein KDD53_07980, partial [Bdellovibrionales bacterium]|nr:hypothetical protein [Bdellovibrionales bacterium]
MLQTFEILLLGAIQYFYTLPKWLGLITLGLISAVLFIIQFNKREKNIVPGVFALIFGTGAIIHFFWPGWMIEYSHSLIVSILEHKSDRGSIWLVEPIFEILAAPADRRMLYEETLVFAFIVYVGFVVHAALTDTTLGIASATVGGIGNLFQREVARPERSHNNELGSGDFATTEQIAKWIKPSGDEGDTSLAVEGLR